MTLLQMPSPLNIRDKARDGMLQGVDPSAYTQTGQSLLYTLVVNLLTLIMAVGALITFAFLILGAIDWITAGGDKGKVEKARDKMIGAVIGLLVLSSTVLIFNMLQKFLGINILPFTSQYTPPNDPSFCSQFNGDDQACANTGVCRTTGIPGNECVPCNIDPDTGVCYPGG